MILKRIINHLVINSAFAPYPGLNGKMGLAVFFYRLHRKTEQKVYDDLANDLIDMVISDMSISMPNNYTYGLAGIGCAIEYLAQNKYVDADTDDILEDTDEAVFMLDRKKLRFESSTNDYYAPGMYYLCRSKTGMQYRNADALNFIENDLSNVLKNVPQNNKISSSFFISIVAYAAEKAHLLSPDLLSLIINFIDSYVYVLNDVEQYIVNELISNNALFDIKSKLKSANDIEFLVTCIDEKDILKTCLLISQCEIFSPFAVSQIKQPLSNRINKESAIIDKLISESDIQHLVACGAILLSTKND